ncbi:MAG: biotin--[acetyl-CoA-carboxylase] ligase [Sphingomonadaceae bacterium]|nr:biotin--[acetyl-CoA-carboxylase] ligase [Sphingomonadaceae bacterium]
MFEEVALTGSTNADLLQRAARGAPEGLWLRAETQDAGRGRLGRTWESPKGNLFASTIVRVRPSDPPASTLAFVAALAVYDTIRQVAPDIAVQIKWPNDLLSRDGAKLCGMLLERADDAVVVGIGLNLTSHPQGLDRPVTDLTTLGARPPHPQAVVEILANAFAIWMDRWRLGGLRGVAQSWQKLSHPIGTALTVNLPDGSVEDGLYSGLDDNGALQLRLADGRIRAIHAGDVFLI